MRLLVESHATARTLPAGPVLNSARAVRGRQRPLAAKYSVTAVLASEPRAITSRHLRPHRVVLIRRQRHCRQDAHDRDHDHQFNEGKTLLYLLHVSAPWICRKFGQRRVEYRTDSGSRKEQFKSCAKSGSCRRYAFGSISYVRDARRRGLRHSAKGRVWGGFAAKSGWGVTNFVTVGGVDFLREPVRSVCAPVAGVARSYTRPEIMRGSHI